MTLYRQFLAALTVCLSLSAGPALAQIDAGTYLAGRQAIIDNQYAQGRDYLQRAFDAGVRDDITMDRLLAANLALGEFARGVELAEEMVELGIPSQTAYLTLLTRDVTEGDWDAVFGNLERGHRNMSILDPLALAWSQVGRGNMNEAIAAFDSVTNNPELQMMAQYHKAAALAQVGDLEGALRIFRQNARSNHGGNFALAQAQLLGALGRHREALELLTVYGDGQTSAEVAELRQSLLAGRPVSFTLLPTPAAGIHDVMMIMASSLSGGEEWPVAMLYARMAQAIRPDDIPTRVILAQILSHVGRLDLAADLAGEVPLDHPLGWRAALDRASYLDQQGNIPEAITALSELIKLQPEDPQVYLSLANILQKTGDHPTAEAHLTTALSLIPPVQQSRWVALYLRGIARTEQGNWPGAEADFRDALALSPTQPEVLNYLGYSLIDRGESLDEALGMIKKAVKAQPDSGAIVDSLAWGFYQLGRYEEALAPSERAVMLMPVDPIITDHYGDILWRLGRRTEARFQWRRALSFDPEAALAARIRDKMLRGLDEVLASEKAQPASPQP